MPWRNERWRAEKRSSEPLGWGQLMSHYKEGPVDRASWIPVVPTAPVIPVFASCCMKGTGAKCGEGMGLRQRR